MMNVYDFDGTIYNGDSTVDFFRFALKRNPALVRFLPRQAMAFLLYAVRRMDKTGLKEGFFCFLAGIDAHSLVYDFWDAHEHKICGWYLKQRRPDDIVISASPEFLLRPVCERLGVTRLIASRVDCATGKFTGNNCRGREKLLRLEREFGIRRIDAFYSDSISDLPLAQIADRAFLIQKGIVTPWSVEKAIQDP